MEFHVSVRDLRREPTVSEAHKRLTGTRRMIAQARKVLDAIEVGTISSLSLTYSCKRHCLLWNFMSANVKPAETRLKGVLVYY